MRKININCCGLVGMYIVSLPLLWSTNFDNRGSLLLLILCSNRYMNNNHPSYCIYHHFKKYFIILLAFLSLSLLHHEEGEEDVNVCTWKPNKTINLALHLYTKMKKEKKNVCTKYLLVMVKNNKHTYNLIPLLTSLF